MFHVFHVLNEKVRCDPVRCLIPTVVCYGYGFSATPRDMSDLREWFLCHGSLRLPEVFEVSEVS